MKNNLVNLTGTAALAVLTVAAADTPPDGNGAGLQRIPIAPMEGGGGIGVSRFDERDVVRQPLVAKIVAAYGRADEARAQARDWAEAGPPVGQTERRGKKDRDGAGK